VVRKIQTSINLTPEIKNIVDTEGLNLSKWVNDGLEKYFSVSSIEDINTKISEHKASIGALEGKRADLLASGVAVTKDEALTNVLLEDMKRFYVARRNQGNSAESDDLWISSPKNLERCKKIGKDPRLVLEDIRSWYCDIQKD